MNASAIAAPTSAIGVHPSSSERPRGAPVGEPERVTQMRAVLPTASPGLVAIKPLRGCPSGAVQRPRIKTVSSSPGNWSLWIGAAPGTVADTWDHVDCVRSARRPAARAQ